MKSGSQDLRGSGTNGLASTVRHFGQPEVYATTAVGLLTAGLVTGNPKLTGMGRHLAASLALTSGIIYGGKALLRPGPAGRSQPTTATTSASSPGGARSPRGTRRWRSRSPPRSPTTSTVPWATVGLYTAAAAVGWSRINDDRHWLSDVAAGAVLGIASAKFASGRWTIFGLRAPSLITGPGGMGSGGRPPSRGGPAHGGTLTPSEARDLARTD